MTEIFYSTDTRKLTILSASIGGREVVRAAIEFACHLDESILAIFLVKSRPDKALGNGVGRLDTLAHAESSGQLFSRGDLITRGRRKEHAKSALVHDSNRLLVADINERLAGVAHAGGAHLLGSAGFLSGHLYSAS